MINTINTYRYPNQILPVIIITMVCCLRQSLHHDEKSVENLTENNINNRL